MQRVCLDSHCCAICQKRKQTVSIDVVSSNLKPSLQLSDPVTSTLSYKLSTEGGPFVSSAFLLAQLRGEVQLPQDISSCYTINLLPLNNIEFHDSITTIQSLSVNFNRQKTKMLIGGAVSYVAGKQAVRTVYWRTASNGRLLKTAKTCMFQGPPDPALSSTSAASSFKGHSRMEPISKEIFNYRNQVTNRHDIGTKETMGQNRGRRWERSNMSLVQRPRSLCTQLSI